MAMTSAQRKRLERLSAEQAYCLGTGRHDFPPLIPGLPVPRGVTISRPLGVYQVERTCRICSRVLTQLHGTSGVRDYDAAPRYAGGGPGFGAEPGTGMTRAMYRDHLDDLQAQAVRDEWKAQRLADRGRADAIMMTGHQARFSSGARQ
jgi:hypothetical protein